MTSNSSIFENFSRGAFRTFCLVAMVVWYSCGAPESAPERSYREGKGGVNFGGVLKMNIGQEARSIFPHNIIDAASNDLMRQVYEGLVSIDPETQEIKSVLAESYEISEDGRIYTFKLRKGVYFHNDRIFPESKGREVKADDVVFCFQKLCTPSKFNQNYALLLDVIKGGSQYYENGGEGSLGVRAVDDYTVEFELEHIAPTFMSILTHPACWIFPREIYQYQDELDSWCVGTGPFVPRTIKMNEVVIFERNKNYWRKDEHGNALPYLDAIRCNFVQSEMRQLEHFEDGNLDLIFSVPYSEVSRLKEDAIQQAADFSMISVPGMRVEYYGFQHNDEIFGDVRARKAIYQAIDRNFLVDSILLGYGIPADYGFIPPSMPGYNAENVQALEFNPDTARALLAEAGFGEENEFPVLTLQVNDGGQTIKVAEAVQRMLTENLGLTVELSVLTKASHYENVEMGQVRFWRDGWIGDYPDPENFLKLFHGKLVPEGNEKASYLNTVRFNDPTFDEFYEASLREPNVQARMELFRKADQIIVDQAAVVPLYYEQWVWLIKKRVTNLNVGGLGDLDLSTVYFKKD